MRFRFRDCIVDSDRFALTRAGEPVQLQPKVLDLLIFLLENRDRTVTKDELLDAVWPDAVTSEGSLTRAVSVARAALGEGKTSAEIIRTVRGRGYAIGVPVEVEVEHATDPAAGNAEPAPSSDFLCRDKELSLARDVLTHAMSGTGQVLLVVGEPGIGKTRLAEEVSAIAERRGALACWGRSPEEGAPSFWPWMQILRAYLAARGAGSVREHLGDRAAQVGEILPEIRDAVRMPTPSDRSDASEARFRLFEAVTTLLLAAAAEQPLVIVLDDLQSTDAASLALLRFLAPALRSSRTLVVATYRDAEVPPGHPLEGTLAELVRSQRPQRTIFLRGLTEGCVRRFTKLFTGIAPSDELVAALYRRTEGNPLFLIELLQWLASQDAGLDERTSLDVRDARIPEGVRHVIGRRLDALSPECQRALQHAAVVGREFSLAVLAPMCGLSSEQVLEHVGEAERARIVEPVRDGSGRFWFTHELIAEALREQLGAAGRARAHRRAGESLEALYTSRRAHDADAAGVVDGAHLAELAHHFGEAAIAGDVGKAIDYTGRAADRAMELLAFEEAAALYDRALRLIEDGRGDYESERTRMRTAVEAARKRAADSREAAT
jgi:predicted ATPase